MDKTLNSLTHYFYHSFPKQAKATKTFSVEHNNSHEDIALNELKVDSMHYMILIGIQPIRPKTLKKKLIGYFSKTIFPVLAVIPNQWIGFLPFSKPNASKILS